MNERIVIVCGLISSGNRMLTQAFQNVGVDAWIVHGIPLFPEGHPDADKARRRSAEKIDELVGGRTPFAVMPVRDMTIRPRSKATQPNGLHDWTKGIDEDAALFRVLEKIVGLRIPFRALSYEAFIRRPAQNFLPLLEWMGVPLPETVEFGWVFDANKKHLQKPA